MQQKTKKTLRDKLAGIKAKTLAWTGLLFALYATALSIKNSPIPVFRSWLDDGVVAGRCFTHRESKYTSAKVTSVVDNGNGEMVHYTYIENDDANMSRVESIRDRDSFRDKYTEDYTCAAYKAAETNYELHDLKSKVSLQDEVLTNLFDRQTSLEKLLKRTPKSEWKNYIDYIENK